MLARVALGGDQHKKSVDVSTIDGYCVASKMIEEDLIRFVTEWGLTHFISLGDLYDRGYAADVAMALSSYDNDIRLAQVLGGNYYGIIGNHLRLGLDSNPELHLIQPHSVYKSRVASNRTEQIMRTPDFLRIGDVQFSFAHCVRDKKYDGHLYLKRQPGVKTHIGIYHTHDVVPANQLMRTGNVYNTVPNHKIVEYLKDVDIAIVGDVHKPLGMFEIDKGTYGKCTMIVPGSLANTNSSKNQYHTTIDMPVITIEDDSSVKLEFKTVDLHTNVLTFKEATVDAKKEKIKSLRGHKVDESQMGEGKGATARFIDYNDWNGYMLKRAYTEIDKDMIRCVLQDPRDLNTLAKQYLSGREGIIG